MDGSSPAAELNKDDLVIEIGSGLGVVTAELAQHVYQLIAVEIDKELLRISQEVLKPIPTSVLSARIS